MIQIKKTWAHSIAASLLCVLLLSAGCATGKTTSSATSDSAPAKQKTIKPAVQTGAVIAPVAPKAKAKKGAPAKAIAKGLSPAEKMKKAAGRSVDAAQPEADFTLDVPAKIWSGDPFLIRFGGEGLVKAVVQWNEKSLTLIPNQDNQAARVCEALLAVDLAEKAKELPLTITATWASGKTEKFSGVLPVGKRKRPVQRLKVASKYVTPPPEVQEKIKQDRKEFRAAISKSSSTKYWTLPMHRPVPGEVTSLYGMSRVFNGVPKAPHKGIDIDAKEGDPIASTDDGIVVMASNHYYGGNTVIVDHGLGVFSVYMHLSAFKSTVGQKVKRGDVVGLVGSTGRVTGPHLHLSFMVQGLSVDAAPCIAM